MQNSKTSCERATIPALTWSLCWAGLVATACDDRGAEREQPRPVQAAPAQTPHSQQAPDPPDETRRPACDIPRANFAFDSAEPLPGTSHALREFVVCLRRSGDGDDAVILVGRTDARGSAAYNKELGWRRAERVRDLLIESGMTAAQIGIRSAGEQGVPDSRQGDARAEERRVDILRSDARVTSK